MLAPIGEMRTPVLIVTPATGLDAAGGETTTYATSEVIFVSLRTLSAKETRSAQEGNQVTGQSTHVLFGHWHDLNDMTSDNRIRDAETGAEYDVIGPPINDQARSFTRLNLLLRENA